MKVLIAYDGSECAKNAIESLARAGLPESGEALILTVVETWLPPEDWSDDSYAQLLGFSGEQTLLQMRQAAREQLKEGEILARDAQTLVRERLPKWKVDCQAVGGFPERQIIETADDYGADLIVVGSHGRGILGRCVLGSVSLKVLSEASCSIRVGRSEKSPSKNGVFPLKIAVALDGSIDSRNALDAVESRWWPTGTAVRLITIIENMPLSVLLEEMPLAEAMRISATETLSRMGLSVSSVVQEGLAKTEVIKEAERWEADTLFIGAKGHRLLERLTLGSVSYSAAARARCSVEVIRGKKHTQGKQAENRKQSINT